MSCKNCGQEPEGAFCPACGRSRRDDDKFCPNCGHRFTDSPAPPTDEQNEPPCRAEERKEAPLLQESRFGSENAPSKTIQSFFRCAHRIPACALGLFSALLFAFFAAAVIFDALCCTVWLILANKRVRKWEPSQARKSPGITAVAVMEGICCLLSVIVAIILTQYELELIFALLPLIPFVYFLALLLVTMLRTEKYRAKPCVAFFGEKNPAKGKAPLIAFDPCGKN